MADTFLTIVNNAILESGADLDQFESDGSDFNLMGHDSLMYKFKTWVQRAWQTIQQEAYDWEWMSEQAVVNINPGIMFYSSSPITWTAGDVNPLTIYDVDNTIKIQDKTVTKVVDLTGKYTDQENFGYIDLLATTSAPLDFGMKSGGEYFLTASSNITQTITAEGSEPLLPVGVPCTATLFDAPDCQIVVQSYEQNPITNEVVYTVSGATASDTLLLLYVFGFVISVTAPDSTVTNISNFGDYPVWSGPSSPSTDAYMRAFWYTDAGVFPQGTTVNAVIDLVGGGQLTIPNVGVFTEVYAPDAGSELNSNASIYLTLSPSGAAQLAAVDPADATNFTFTSDIGYMETEGVSGEIIINLIFTSAPKKNYIHSWKSFDWSEETQDDDFVEMVAEIDNDSFRLVTHEIPAPGLEIKLPYMHWELFRMRYDNATVPPSQPRVITEDNTGRWRLYPAPDVPYTLLFDYVRNPQKLTDFDDVPKGLPDDYSDIVMWRALMYYGEYDEQPSVAARATRNYKDMLSRLELRFRDKFHFQPYKLW